MKRPIPFGKYLLLDRVNVGGMAEVFKAKVFGVEGFERLVAVKRILPSIAEDQEFITMFIDEAKIAVQLTHANIAQIFDLGRVVDAFFIAMEYVHGKDLRAIFDHARKRGETIPVAMTCYVVMKICEGLDYAHNKRDPDGSELNLVHRDVSPQNILLSYDGETKIIDFGIAKAAGKVGKTQAGILKGKFGYMSPEQVRGLPLDRRSDVFALGIVLYELLTGERLFLGESDFSTLEKVRNVEIMPPSTYNRRVPEELEQIVLKALARDVDDRYQTAVDLHDDLQSFMYTSGSFFSRKDLSAYMREAFSQDIELERAREEEYRALEVDPSLRELDSGAIEELMIHTPEPSMPTPATPPPPSLPRVGQSRNAARPRGGPPPPPPSAYPAPVGGYEGSPAAGGPGHIHPPSSFSSGPPPAASYRGAAPAFEPNPALSMPDPRPVSSERIPLARPAPSASPLAVDWGDEELSTQVYDPPEPETPEPLGKLPDLPDLLDPTWSQPMETALPTDPSSPGAAPDPRAVEGFTKHGSLSDAGLRSSGDALRGLSNPLLPLADGSPNPRFGSGPASGPELLGRDPSLSISRGDPSPFAPSAGGATGLSTSLRVDRPMRVVLSAAAAFGVLAIVGVTALLMRAQPATLQLSTEPKDAVIYLDQQPVATSTSSPFVIANVEPGQHLLEVRREGFQPWATRVDLASSEVLQLPTVRLEPAEGSAEASASKGATGFTLQTTPPGAKVYVDNRRLPQVSPVTVHDLTPGTHTLRVEARHFLPWTSQVQVTAGQVVQLPQAVLTLQNAKVRFESDPAGALVTVLRGSERRRVGKTPRTATLNATGGAWTVEFTAPGRRTITRPLIMSGQQTEYTVSATMEEDGSTAAQAAAARPAPAPRRAPARRARRRSPPRRAARPPARASAPPASEGGGPGVLMVQTRPWSQVYVDGRLVGNTPQRNISLPAGRHRVRLVNPRFNVEEEVTVRIRAGQTERLIRTLSPGG